ncbi:MAG TPA: hypothetical protein VMF29_05955 [Candidatus Edwardsbacteria bacterium]|nr:hypothetical protein [Candidatus Edwardsbacteria bacterium]
MSAVENGSPSGFREFFSRNGDVISLITFVVCVVGGALARIDYLPTIGYSAAVVNFIVTAKDRNSRDKSDERLRHLKHVAGYYALITIFSGIGVLGLIQALYGPIVRTAGQLAALVVAFGLFAYSMAYTILKRVR